MQNNSINLPILDISLTDRIGMLMEREPSIASGLAKYQQETINKISQSLGYSRKDVLEGICLYYTKREKTKIAITYANMYINETDVTADDLAKVFRVIVDSLLITTTPERFAEKKMPRGMGKFMKKADSF